MNEQSRAAVRNYPGKNVHEITVDSGQAQVTRGSTSVQLGQYEELALPPQPGLVRNKIIAPPALLTPQNMELRQVADPKSTQLEFSWTDVPGATSYHLQISPSVMLANFVVDKKVSGQDVDPDFRAGRRDLLLDGECHRLERRGKPTESGQPVEPVAPTLGNQAYLEVTKIIQHGKVVEVQGKTEPINGDHQQ